MTRIFRAMVMISAGLMAAGCASNVQYRTNFDASGGDPKQAVVESTPDYKLGFVEFDDQGAFWDLRQRAAVETMIQTEAGIDSAHPATPRGIVLVAFVHGWKNNSAYDGEGVKAFRSILEQLSDGEKFQDHPPRKVVGVYVGWRGLSSKWEPFREFSFWERKDTAHKVGGYGALTELLVDLENIQKRSLKLLPQDEPRTELVIIGHSFGGAAVYSALSQIIIERFASTLGRIDAGDRREALQLRPLGDQVILLNPAFEAQRYYDLNRMARQVKDFPAKQRPVLSIFTSQGDWATHYVFPIGQFFSTLFQSSSSDEQAKAGKDAVGWYADFLTHTLKYSPNTMPTTRASTRPGPFNRAQQEGDLHDPGEMRESVQRVRDQRGRWAQREQTAKPYEFYESVLTPVAGLTPGYPFLVVSVDKKIMSNHTDIANPVLIKFLRDYIQFCQVDAGDHSMPGRGE